MKGLVLPQSPLDSPTTTRNPSLAGEMRRGRKSKPKVDKQIVSEDFCFVCKDGGDVRICDFGDCLKVYHPECVDKDPSFLRSKTYWKCGWHSCLLCKKSADIKCISCPTSICRTCIEDADFVQMKEKSMGFCRPCLKRVKMIEEKADVDSDGEKVDFYDLSTYEGVFKEYWEILNGSLRISLEELQFAYKTLKEGCHFTCTYGSEDEFEENDTESDGEVYKSALNGKSKGSIKKHGSKRKKFVGWGSEELLDFLISIGKNVQKPLSQRDACEAIKRYVWDNKLLHRTKKKKVLCDEKLYKLFKKRTVSIVKIYDLLEGHFPEDMDDIFYLDSEEEQEVVSKTMKTRNHDNKVQYLHTSNNHSGALRSTYASVIDKNIKLVCLKRSLIQDFLKNPEDFENKVVGCFVRVKIDPVEFRYSNRTYQLGQVTGFKQAQEALKFEEISTSVALRVSSIIKDVNISCLSDDDFTEEECEDLRQLVKKGLHKRPTIEELENKSALLYGEIMKHWLNKEMITIQKQIDQANEKGWRRKLCELIERREQLCLPEELARLLKIPEVIPDIEPVAGCDLSAHPDSKDKDQGVKIASNECNETLSVKKNIQGKNGKKEVALNLIYAKDSEVKENGYIGKANGKESQGDQEASSSPERIIFIEDGDHFVNFIEDDGSEIVEVEGHSVDLGEEKKDAQVVDIEEHDENHTHLPKKLRQTEIVILDDDGNDEIQVCGDTNPTSGPSHVSKEAESELWNYLDPLRRVQGPFRLETLRLWHKCGFFDNNFKVWKSDQCQDKAILLTDALGI